MVRVPAHHDHNGPVRRAALVRRLRQVLEIGCLPTDSDREKVTKEVFVVMNVGGALAGVRWSCGPLWHRSSRYSSGPLAKLQSGSQHSSATSFWPPCSMHRSLGTCSRFRILRSLPSLPSTSPEL